MDEQAGLQEQQRTAPVPPNPLAAPPSHPRQSWESAGATGRRKDGGLLQSETEGQDKKCSNRGGGGVSSA